MSSVLSCWHCLPVAAACRRYSSRKKLNIKARAGCPPWEVPPDLTSPSRDDRYAVPDVATRGSATLSTYNAERGGGVRAGSTEILPNVAKVRIERAGSERWLGV